MRFAPCQHIGPRNLSTLPPPDIPPPIQLDAPMPVQFSASATGTVSASLRFCVAVDFDGVLCRPAWPKVGEEMPGAMAFLQWLGERDVCRVLWTCRHGGKLDEALAWLAERGFPRDWWDAVNDTPEPIARFYGGDTRKIGANAFLDDRAIGFPSDPGDASMPHWPRIQDDLLARLADWNEARH